MLVVCKDTDHAKWAENYIKSDKFCQGAYRNKTLVIHSKQTGAESEANTKMLLEVEKAENPIEIVIHVNMLKEGWDVNNLYTIVPLRTASSKILREQMVGRGLRLPYGERTGDKEIDSVMLTAHDKFADILAEAEKGDSIFNAGNIIRAEDFEPEEEIEAQLALEEEPDEILTSAYLETGIERTEQADKVFHTIHETVVHEVYQEIQNAPSHTVTPDAVKQIAAKAVQKTKDLGQVFHENSIPDVVRWTEQNVENVYEQTNGKFIPIPRIKITENGAEDYVFEDFNINLDNFKHEPISNEMLIQNLVDTSERKRISAGAIDFEGYQPKNTIVDELCEKPEIDYDKCSKLLFKLTEQVIEHYRFNFGTNGMQNIVMMYKKEIADLIYKQMLQHFKCDSGFIQEEVIDIRTYNIQPHFNPKSQVNLFGEYTGDIRSVLFTGIKKGVFTQANFDSDEGELTFARMLERDEDVLKWLRPAPSEFNITYHQGSKYEPDFVVETEANIYLVEVKAEKDMANDDVIAKKQRGIQYCETATRWCEANGYKPWNYLFVPANKIYVNTTFKQIVRLFTVTNEK